MQRPVQRSCETLCQTCLPSCLSPAASLHRQRSCDLRRGCKQNLHIERQFVERRCHSTHIMCSASQTDATPVASLPALLPLTGMTNFGLDLDHVPHSVCRLISLSLFCGVFVAMTALPIVFVAEEAECDTAHAFSSFANWIIPGKVLLGRYPYVEPSRCR